MPKQKNHKGLSKRMKVTGTGKVKRQRSFGSHLMSTKNAKRRRRITGSAMVKGKPAKTCRDLIAH
ncbi:MAG: 50S ribosomal protein L35 [Phycisphaerae bacterium]|nr:50S ribosomal protein L35 [Phycisphaerae bacterium]